MGILGLACFPVLPYFCKKGIKGPLGNSKTWSELHYTFIGLHQVWICSLKFRETGFVRPSYTEAAVKKVFKLGSFESFSLRMWPLVSTADKNRRESNDQECNGEECPACPAQPQGHLAGAICTYVFILDHNLLIYVYLLGLKSTLCSWVNPIGWGD